MDNTQDGAALADCIAPLDEEGRRAVRRHWDRVIREEMRDIALRARGGSA